jgi:hemerythrin-like domain-containing protein
MIQTKRVYEPVEKEDGILEFLSIFVDRCHHGKEEEFLFPVFESAGAAQERDLIGVLMKEHKEGRELVARLEDAVKRRRSGEKTGERSVKDTLDEYATLLTQHIVKENTHLFPMVEMKLDSDTDSRLIEAFQKLETERIGLGKHEEFHELFHLLRDTYLT